MGQKTALLAGSVVLLLSAVAGCTGHSNRTGGENGPRDLSNDDLRDALPSVDDVDDVVPLVGTERDSNCIPEFDQAAKEMGRRTRCRAVFDSPGGRYSVSLVEITLDAYESPATASAAIANELSKDPSAAWGGRQERFQVAALGDEAGGVEDDADARYGRSVRIVFRIDSLFGAAWVGPQLTPIWEEDRGDPDLRQQALDLVTRLAANIERARNGG